MGKCKFFSLTFLFLFSVNIMSAFDYSLLVEESKIEGTCDCWNVKEKVGRGSYIGVNLTTGDTMHYMAYKEEELHLKDLEDFLAKFEIDEKQKKSIISCYLNLNWSMNDDFVDQSIKSAMSEGGFEILHYFILDDYTNLVSFEIHRKINNHYYIAVMGRNRGNWIDLTSALYPEG